ARSGGSPIRGDEREADRARDQGAGKEDAGARQEPRVRGSREGTRPAGRPATKGDWRRGGGILTFEHRHVPGKGMPMPWKLRLYWYRADKAGLVFAAYFVAVVGALVFALDAAFAYRDAEAARAREFHARSIDCLARNVYYEARGESVAGQYAVAEVTMNRRS